MAIFGGQWKVGNPLPKAGIRKVGNIDLNARPKVRNSDGSISTVRSLSFGADEGEVLVPTVSDDGRIMEDDEAIDNYYNTGRHLGIFDTPQAATAYANALHGSQERKYAGPEMALFGGKFNDGKWGQRLGLAGATLQDIGGNLSGGPTGYLDQYQQRQEMQRQKTAQDAAYGNFMDQFGQANEISLPMIMQAQQAGLDVKPYMDWYDMQQKYAPTYDAVNIEGGGLGAFNKRTGQFDMRREPNPWQWQEYGTGAGFVNPRTREIDERYSWPKHNPRAAPLVQIGNDGVVRPGDSVQSGVVYANEGEF